MATTIQKWGNSLAVRIPKEIAHRLALRPGSGVSVHEDRNAIIIRTQEPRERQAGKNDWVRYLIPIKHKKEAVSRTVDHLVYGASH
jgi:antitoxin component of MazEF toxin-antitoxin module